MNYRQAKSSDLVKICELLEIYDLPASDCKEHVSNFIVAEYNNKIIGVGGYEDCGDLGLLRSFAVRDGDKGHGIAEKIFGLIKAKAIVSGINQFYLLTETANKYFERLGFSPCNRDDTPSSIKATKQFSELCPSTAEVMVLNLCA